MAVPAEVKPRRMVLVIECAAKLNIDARTIHSWWKKGHVYYERKNDKVYVDIESVRAYDKERRSPKAALIGPMDIELPSGPMPPTIPLDGFAAANQLADVYADDYVAEITAKNLRRLERDEQLAESRRHVENPANVVKPPAPTSSPWVASPVQSPRERITAALETVQFRRLEIADRFAELAKEEATLVDEDGKLAERERALNRAFEDVDAAERLARFLAEDL